MLQIVKPFISVRIDVAADSSDMAIILPTLQFLDKCAFRIFHTDGDGSYQSESTENGISKHSMIRDFM